MWRKGKCTRVFGEQSKTAVIDIEYSILQCIKTIINAKNLYYVLNIHMHIG